MASRDINLLEPVFKERLLYTTMECQKKGLDILVYCTVRSLEEQAKLYRQSRTTAQIEAKKREFYQKNLLDLARAIDFVGTQSGPHVTNAAPGESWHNFGEAADCVPLINGKPAWNAKQYPKEWKLFGDIAVSNGLEWAGHWKRFKEFPHVQTNFGGESPTKILTPDLINDTFYWHS